jgi:hypothetical protein
VLEKVREEEKEGRARREEERRTIEMHEGQRV